MLDSWWLGFDGGRGERRRGRLIAGALLERLLQVQHLQEVRRRPLLHLLPVVQQQLPHRQLPDRRRLACNKRYDQLLLPGGQAK